MTHLCESKKNEEIFIESLSLFRKIYLSTFPGSDNKVYVLYKFFCMCMSMNAPKIGLAT